MYNIELTNLLSATAEQREVGAVTSASSHPCVSHSELKSYPESDGIPVTIQRTQSSLILTRKSSSTEKQ